MRTITLIFVLALAVELPVFGYIDPGTGSYVFQILIASLLAVSFVIRRFWDKIWHTLSSFLGKKRDQPKP